MDAGLTFHLRKRTVAVLLLIAAILAMVISRPDKPGELAVYMKAAERILRGEQIYRTDDTAAFTYPPFFVLPTVPLAPLPHYVRARVWWFANLCLAGVILFLIARLLWPVIARGEERGRRRWLLALTVAVLAGRFLISPLEYKSHDLIVLALVVLAGCAMACERDSLAGVCIGLAAACKATPLLFLPVLLWQRRYRAVACCLGALVAATLLPDMLFPSPDGRLWVADWYDKFISKVQVDAPAHAAGAWSAWNMLNQGLAATIYRLTAPVETQGGMINVCLLALHDASRQRLTLALELLVVGWLAWRMWPRRMQIVESERGLFALTQVGMVVSAMLLLSPMSSSQHFAALVVPISACATDWLYRRRDPVIATALLLVFAFGTLAARDLLGSYAIWPQVVGCKTWLALALFVACGRTLRSMEKPRGTVFYARIAFADESKHEALPRAKRYASGPKIEDRRGAGVRSHQADSSTPVG